MWASLGFERWTRKARSAPILLLFPLAPFPLCAYCFLACMAALFFLTEVVAGFLMRLALFFLFLFTILLRLGGSSLLMKGGSVVIRGYHPTSFPGVGPKRPCCGTKYVKGITLFHSNTGKRDVTWHHVLGPHIYKG